MKETFFFVFIIVILSCNAELKKQKNYKKYNFPLKTFSSDYEENKDFSIYLPKGGAKKKKHRDRGNIYLEYQIYYKNDSSIFYITNDILNPSHSNRANLYKDGIKGYHKERLLDTITYQGVQKNGLYWKENVRGEIVLGYLNVPSNRKNEFDRLLETIRKK